MSAPLRGILGKGVYGVGLRAAQALLLLVVVLRFDDEAQSEVAVVLVAAVTLNLVTNFGLPTILVRALGRRDTAEAAVGVITRAYFLSTIAGCAFILPAVALVTGSVSAGAAAVALLLGLSMTGFLEYWALGHGEYGSFLRSAAPAQVVVGLSAAPIAALAHDPLVGVLVLALSALAPFLYRWSRLTVATIRRCAAHAQLSGSDPWLRSAAQVGAATVGAAILYGADVFLLRLTGHVGEDAVYRVAIAFIGFAVGLLPASFFTLAASAAGERLRWRGPLLAIAVSASVACVVGGLVATRLDGTIDDAGVLLLVLAPLGFLRVVTQVAAAQGHGRGHHAEIARLFGTGAVAFVFCGTVAASTGGTYALAATQIAVESAMALVLVARQRQWAPRGAVMDTPAR